MYTVYGDESGTTGSDRCYSIGLLSIKTDRIEKLNDYVLGLKHKHGIVGELKWSKIKNSAGQANVCLDLLKMVLKSSCCFHSIVVEKSKFNNWRSDREHAFYQTYTYLLKNMAKHVKSPIQVFIDQKCDKYDKNDEVVGIIANNMLGRMGLHRSVQNVEMANSKDHLGLQVVDILTGAVNSGYLKFLNSDLVLSEAKEAAFPKLSEILGWDAFHYDTYPNSGFNIWHFPSENRARPGTRNIHPNYDVGSVAFN